VVDDTGGLRVIQYFAYVGGLVKLAYEVMQERDSEEEGHGLGEQYPLVLDAAFSHADQTHTQNIARELASAASQLIFAVMPKDWAYAKEGLAGKVSKIYELKKIDESEAQIVEVK
jgi:DNA sulfur modification protein DndD